MAKGGLLDLVAHGVQDIYLIGNPNYSFFKKVYKRHTNFVSESIRCTFDGTGNFGNKIVLEIPRNGDLINTIIMEVDLPELAATGSDNSHSIQYIENIGQALIEFSELKIGGQTIDKQYSEWVYMWSQLTLSSPKLRDYNQMIKSNAQNGPLTVYIPFYYWFCRDISNSLPLVALQYHKVELEITLQPLEKLYNFGPRNYYDLQFVEEVQHLGTTQYKYKKLKGINFLSTVSNKLYMYNNGNQSANITYVDPNNILLDVRLPDSGLVRGFVKPTYELVGNPSITDIRIYVDYIYLDTFERQYFAKEEHRYLIEQIQYNEGIGVTNAESTKKTDIDFNLPVKELFWILQNNEVLANNELLNFSNSPDPLYETPVDDINNLTFLYNGNERFEPRSGEYFRLVQPFQKHRQSVFDKYIYVYSIAAKPEDHQPSGASNFSKIDRIEFISNLRSNRPYNSLLKIFGLNYNILRITKGMGGVAFSN
jgi:hypothetical protein